MNIFTSCRVFFNLLWYREKFKKFGLPYAFEIYNKRDSYYILSRWNRLFSKASASIKTFTIFQSLPESIPGPEEIAQSGNKTWGFMLSGRYFSPSNPQGTKEGYSCYLSEWYLWAEKQGYQLFCRFFDNETVEIFLISQPYVKKFKDFYTEYNPLYKYSYFNPELSLYCIPEKGWSISNNKLVFKNYASYYVISLNHQPVELKTSMKWETDVETSIRSHLEFTRVFETTGLSYSGELPAVKLNPYQGQGLQWVNLNSNQQPVSVISISFDAHLIDYREFCLQLAPDRYQRHQIIADIFALALNKKMEKPTIGDWGGNPGLLHNFLPQYKITVIDQFPLDYPYHLLSGEAEQNGELKFDYTTALDVLEHIPSLNRKDFLETVYSMSRYGSILSFPAGNKNVSLAENILFEFEKKWVGRENNFLLEHLRNPLPENSLVEEFCLQKGIPFRLIPNAYLPHWFYMMCILLMKDLSPENQEKTGALLYEYNKNCYSSDNRFPAYRSVWIIGELAANICEKEFIMEKSDEEIQMQWSPVDLPDVLRRYGLEDEALWLDRQKVNLRLISQGKKLE